MKILTACYPEDSGFWGEVVCLPGCATQGGTREEFYANIKEAFLGVSADWTPDDWRSLWERQQLPHTIKRPVAWLHEINIKSPHELRDGVPFKLGMKVVFWSNREEETSPDKHEVKEVVFEGVSVPVLQSKGGSGGIGLNLLYSSQEGRIAHQVGYLESLKKLIDNEIRLLRSGEDPHLCDILERNI
jgi:predicted RNase H-like HicB family nuclease